MCFEFAHTCDQALISKVKAIGKEQFFMVCLWSLNYLYTQDKAVIEKLKEMFFPENIVLHIIPEQETRDILLVPETISFQQLHGNNQLFTQFMNMAKPA